MTSSKEKPWKVCHHFNLLHFEAPSIQPSLHIMTSNKMDSGLWIGTERVALANEDTKELNRHLPSLEASGAMKVACLISNPIRVTACDLVLGWVDGCSSPMVACNTGELTKRFAIVEFRQMLSAYSRTGTFRARHCQEKAYQISKQAFLDSLILFARLIIVQPNLPLGFYNVSTVTIWFRLPCQLRDCSVLQLNCWQSAVLEIRSTALFDLQSAL